MTESKKECGKHYDYGFRIYNPSIGKFLSVDPLTSKYPMLTPYQFAGNRPIDAIDLDGLETYKDMGNHRDPGMWRSIDNGTFREDKKVFDDAFLKTSVAGLSTIGIIIVAPAAPAAVSPIATNMLRGAFVAGSIDTGVQLLYGEGTFSNRLNNLDLSDIAISSMQGASIITKSPFMLKLGFNMTAEFTKSLTETSIASGSKLSSDYKKATNEAIIAVTLSYSGELFGKTLSELGSLDLSKGLYQAKKQLERANKYLIKGGQDNNYVKGLKESINSIEKELKTNKNVTEKTTDILTGIVNEETKENK